MILLIDAYNLIKQIYGKSEVLDREILKFTNELRSYLKKTSNSAILIFDGGFNNFITVSREKSLEIVYAGYSKIADDLIKKYLNDLNPDSTILVTSDLELVNFAKSRSFETIQSIDFYRNYFKVGQGDKFTKLQSTDFVKTNNSEMEIDDLMKQYSSKVQLKKEDNDFGFELKSKGVSKKDKKREKILKKL